VFTDDEINEMPLKDYRRRLGTAMGELKDGDNRITEFWNQNSILNLVKHIPEEQKTAVRFYLDIRDEGFLYKGNSLLHIAMRDLKIPHEYRVRNGAHDFQYWRSGLPSVLAFISENFR
jgi:S-formylglutathione hydrolase FrmB